MTVYDLFSNHFVHVLIQYAELKQLFDYHLLYTIVEYKHYIIRVCN